MARKKTKTAADFSAELERDPEYQGRLARIERDAEAQGEAAASDERSLVADLEEAGIRIQSVYDLVNGGSGARSWRRLIMSRGSAGTASAENSRRS